MDTIPVEYQAAHQVHVLTATEDSQPLSGLVRQALRNNGQTMTSRVRVSQDNEDTVKLSGFVNDDAIRYKAERVAYQVEGVRFVVNNLALRNWHQRFGVTAAPVGPLKNVLL